ncbi:hypothetical protein [Acinetobacter sp. ANC 3882]|uniref:hypothetical protein n=1 Tax=Acinetobacter sp. ANC 3882 TaxID=2923423 RepID=UPI001F4B1A65|nr:hypothetical protein [Acinetobacter sp. ANC 3882]MCH7314106.1 hypothetical protein [Acinetobacter sp. ANC 3882]
MKKIAAFLLVLMGLGLMIFYFQSSGTTSSQEDKAVYQTSQTHSEKNKTEIKSTEAKTKEQVNSILGDQLDTSQQGSELYDTKSDPSIQPIDPDTDQANEIKQL